ncbi:MAG: ABC transporter permease [Spirochaetota bacterium]
MIELHDSALRLSGEITRSTVPELFAEFRRRKPNGVRTIDLSRVEKLDNAGAAFLEYVRDRQATPPSFVGANETVSHALELFAGSPAVRSAPEVRRGPLERLGDSILRTLVAARDYFRLAADIVYWTLAAPFDRRSRRAGSVGDQCERIGLRAVPIVAFLALVLGVIVVLQAAVQLRRFGATLYVVDLLGVSMTRETGPLFTAIIVAGRSGAAITAQLATMRVTEELDALTVMALDPIRYVVVPMMLGMLLTIPLLTAISVLVGIAGGVGIAALSLDLSAETFANRLAEIVGRLDLFVGIAKSFFFGAAIVLTASYFGLTSSGGAEGVGSSTTRSVVVSIFAVIVLNALFSLLYLV